MIKRIFFSLSISLFATLILFRCSPAFHRHAAEIDDRSYYEESVNRTPQPASKQTRMASESTAESIEQDTAAEPAHRMIIYRGTMQMQVVNPESALQSVSLLVKNHGGFIESTTYQDDKRSLVVNLRVPVEKFFDMMDALPEIGIVQSRSIQASDVTAEFSDVQNRLKSARLLKERLERLMTLVKNVEEKVKILREINRLAQEIEILSARSKELSDRSSMSTIVLHLSARPQPAASPVMRSPFPVVRNLNPAKRSILSASSIKAKRPEGFFDNSREFQSGASYQFYSPDGTVLRSGEVRNQPAGDAAFWKRAMQIEFERRSYKEIQNAPLLNGYLFVYRIHDGLNIYYYGISFRITESKIQIFEAISPREEAYRKDGARMVEFLRSIGDQP